MAEETGAHKLMDEQARQMCIMYVFLSRQAKLEARRQRRMQEAGRRAEETEAHRLM